MVNDITSDHAVNRNVSDLGSGFALRRKNGPPRHRARGATAWDLSQCRSPAGGRAHQSHCGQGETTRLQSLKTTELIEISAGHEEVWGGSARVAFGTKRTRDAAVKTEHLAASWPRARKGARPFLFYPDNTNTKSHWTLFGVSESTRVADGCGRCSRHNSGARAAG